MSKYGFGRLQEAFWFGKLAHCIGRYRADPSRRQTAQTLAEACKTGQGPFAARIVEATVRSESCGKADTVAQPINHARLTMLHARNNEMKAVRTQIRGGEQLAIAYGLPIAFGLVLDAIVQGHSFASRVLCAECGTSSPGAARS